MADAAGAEPPSSESAGAGSGRGGGAARWVTGCEPLPPMPVPEPLARPGKRELDAARRLIARHGMPLVLAVAEWASLPPSRTGKGDASGKPYDGFSASRAHRPPPSHGTGTRYASRWPATPTGVACRRTRRHRRQGAKRRSRRARNPRRRCRTTASPTTWTAGRGDCSPPYDFDAGNDGFRGDAHPASAAEARPSRTTRKANAMPCWRHCGRARAFLDAESRRRTTASGGGSRPRPGRHPSVFGFIGGLPKRGAGMFLKGECADFLGSWSDRMWGPTTFPTSEPNTIWRRAAVRICEACPVRPNASRSASWSGTSTASTADCPCAPDARC